MHGPEESDSVIVAMKPTNKAEQSVAEPVEPRTETKGNADQQSTRRAQDRASVSQALERVRQAARQRKKERFTSLLHHVDPAMLRTAFYAMKRDAAPGVDGLTLDVGDLRRGSRSKYRGPARAGQKRSVPGVTVPSELYSEGRRQQAPAGGRRSRGQNRPESNGRGAERDLRGGFPRVLVWVPT